MKRPMKKRLRNIDWCVIDGSLNPGTAEKNEIMSKTTEKMGAKYLRDLADKFNEDVKTLMKR